jgi:hypothetical protein
MLTFLPCVRVKEKKNMARITRQGMLPEGMALVQTADSKWFPAFATMSVRAHCVYVLEDGEVFIPPALPPYHDPAQGYNLREEAIEACHVWREAIELLEEWQALAARTELYPERTSWYLDEIVLLSGGDDTPRLHCGTSAHVVVHVRLTGADSGTRMIAVTADTPDEAIEMLYERVYEWAQTSQAASHSTDPR